MLVWQLYIANGWHGPVFRQSLRILLVVVAASSAGPSVAAETRVDMQLLIAIDSSGSVDDREFALQMSGVARAFRDPEVVAAIASGPHGRIGATVMLWAESNEPKFTLPWRVIDNADSAAGFADAIETQARTVFGGTGIGRAIVRAVDVLHTSPLASPRDVIDISGDGRETTFRDYSVGPNQARFRAMAFGVTINGLAILTDEPDLASYYARNVIAGPDAFVMVAETFEDFAAAMKRKLIREIEYRPQISRLPRAIGPN